MSDKDVEVLKRDVQQILFYLKNDDDADRKGLIAEVAELKKGFADFLQAYKIEKAIKNAKVGLIASIGAGLAVAIEFLLKYIFKI